MSYKNGFRKSCNGINKRKSHDTPCGIRFLGNKCRIKKLKPPDSSCNKCEDYLEYLKRDLSRDHKESPAAEDEDVVIRGRCYHWG